MSLDVSPYKHVGIFEVSAIIPCKICGEQKFLSKAPFHIYLCLNFVQMNSYLNQPDP